ncbi:MAG: preprotein translocase subunit YajC [Clostridia bacterium]|nr:preprotein translocase subunit YajC [Clostridia bacterium]MBQ4086556.1 preprotein translocase subunit YajC [Clostridia bacterium]
MKKTLTALGAMLAMAPAALAQTAAAPEDMGMASMIPSLVLMVAMIVVFYFMLIRPQKKKDKAVKDMLAALKNGDRVCTIGGIYGTISNVRDDTITLAVGPQKVPMMFARWAIRSVEDAPLENDSEPLV